MDYRGMRGKSFIMEDFKHQSIIIILSSICKVKHIKPHFRHHQPYDSALLFAESHSQICCFSSVDKRNFRDVDDLFREGEKLHGLCLYFLMRRG